MQRRGVVPISVAGRKGADIAGLSRAVVSASSIDGYNAPLAEDGESADNITAELVPDSRGFKAEYRTGSGITSRKSVSPGDDLLFDLRGGDGADGGLGGDGKNGYQGARGVNATAHSDATPGQKGGRGGNAGRGSDGGDGGNGGNLSVILQEQYMHLAFAVSWNVTPGKGGTAGRHGNPGKGGRGGRGGSSYSWQEHTGWRWSCAEGCTSSGGSSTALTTRTSSNQDALSRLRTDRGLYFAFPQGVVSDGINHAEVRSVAGHIPASLAPQFRHALLESSSSSNAVVRHNNDGSHISGCQQKRTYTSRHRPGADRGSDGMPGRLPGGPLPRPGRTGRSGKASICVRSEDGVNTVSYNAKFEFQLLDFEVVDENRDCIFEPGECLIIRNIRVRNNAVTGGMPTPRKTRIPVRMLGQPGLTPRNSLWLPLGLKPGETRLVDGEIKADISAPTTRSLFDVLHEQANVQLEAVLPDLDRILPHFDYRQTITIQHPLRLLNDGFTFLDSVAPGTTTSLQWQFENISRNDLGGASASRREVATEVYLLENAPGALGTNLAENTNAGPNHSEKRVTLARSNQAIKLSEGLFVFSNAKNRVPIQVVVKLLLEPPNSRNERRHTRNPKLIQQYKFMISICNPWIKTSAAQYLLLASKATDRVKIEAYENFIQRHLKMSINVFDVSLYGGLRADDMRKQVLTEYSGKTIIALDDELFEYSTQGERSVLDFIDPGEAVALSSQGTTITSIQRDQGKRRLREKSSIQLIARAAALDEPGMAQQHTTYFDSADELLVHLQQSQGSQRARRYHVRESSSNPDRQGKRLARQLQKAFPLDRFVISPDEHHSGLVVTHCHGQGDSFSAATLTKRSKDEAQLDDYCGLDPAEAYTCVSSLPLKKRLDILQVSYGSSDASRCPYSTFSRDAAKHSVLVEIHQQVQAMTSAPKWSDAAFTFKKEKHTTRSLFENANDKITTVLEHDIMLPPDGMTGNLHLSSIAIELLSSIVRSARCQNLEQLCTKWFNPLRRTRSHVRKYLMEEVKQKIAPAMPDEGVTKDLRNGFKTFRRSRSVRQSVVHLDYRKNLDSNIHDLTSGAIQSTNKTFNSIESELSKTQYVPVDALEKSKASFNQATARRQHDEEHHRRLKQRLGTVMPAPRSPSPVIEEQDPSSSSVEATTSTGRRSIELGATPVSTRAELERSEVQFPPELGAFTMPMHSHRDPQNSALPTQEPLTRERELVGGSLGLATELPTLPLSLTAELHSNPWAIPEVHEVSTSPRLRSEISDIAAELPDTQGPFAQAQELPLCRNHAELEAPSPPSDATAIHTEVGTELDAVAASTNLAMQSLGKQLILFGNLLAAMANQSAQTQTQSGHLVAPDVD
ncbi:hypothetical protein EJ04DRAFT_549698 [Polyplosphaeria fusca]|uniref:DUF7932 domain-containing protein n=1 Tax=Polyplosphaeria fusca TaxID=682080 RepID=A0A9P4R8E2_9PLEO|nr:hypothetical protein EJ04DRAFT_549698 [Polyplosphaeria fusca]